MSTGSSTLYATSPICSSNEEYEYPQNGLPLQETLPTSQFNGAQVVPDSLTSETPPSVQQVQFVTKNWMQGTPPSAQPEHEMEDCKYPIYVLEHMGPYRLSAQSGLPMSEDLRPSSPTTEVVEEILDLEDLRIDFSSVDGLNNFIQEGSDISVLPFTSDMSWEEIRSGFELLHLFTVKKS